jgi:hypothetical protein
MGGLLASQNIIPMVLFVGLFSWLSIYAIVSAIQGIVKHRNEIELKQMLAARGMSAEEIERVLQASSPSGESE